MGANGEKILERTLGMSGESRGGPEKISKAVEFRAPKPGLVPESQFQCDLRGAPKAETAGRKNSQVLCHAIPKRMSGDPKG